MKQHESEKAVKLAVLFGVREYSEHDQVELWLNETRRVVVRCHNECGNNYTELDLFDLLGWVRSGGLQEQVNEEIPIEPIDRGN